MKFNLRCIYPSVIDDTVQQSSPVGFIYGNKSQAPFQSNHVEDQQAVMPLNLQNQHQTPLAPLKLEVLGLPGSNVDGMLVGPHLSPNKIPSPKIRKPYSPRVFLDGEKPTSYSSYIPMCEWRSLETKSSLNASQILAHKSYSRFSDKIRQLDEILSGVNSRLSSQITTPRQRFTGIKGMFRKKAVETEFPFLKDSIFDNSRPSSIKSTPRKFEDVIAVKKSVSGSELRAQLNKLEDIFVRQEEKETLHKHKRGMPRQYLEGKSMAQVKPTKDSMLEASMKETSRNLEDDTIVGKPSEIQEYLDDLKQEISNILTRKDCIKEMPKQPVTREIPKQPVTKEMQPVTEKDSIPPAPIDTFNELLKRLDNLEDLARGKSNDKAVKFVNRTVLRKGNSKNAPDRIPAVYKQLKSIFSRIESYLGRGDAVLKNLEVSVQKLASSAGKSTKSVVVEDEPYKESNRSPEVVSNTLGALPKTKEEPRNVGDVDLEARTKLDALAKELLVFREQNEHILAETRHVHGQCNTNDAQLKLCWTAMNQLCIDNETFCTELQKQRTCLQSYLSNKMSSGPNDLCNLNVDNNTFEAHHQISSFHHLSNQKSLSTNQVIQNWSCNSKLS